MFVLGEIINLLLQMDQVMTQQVLLHHVLWLVEDDFQILGLSLEWLYVLLARMGKPLHIEKALLLQQLL